MTRPQGLPGSPHAPEASAGLSDAALFQAFSDGRSHAFDVLVARYGDRVRAYIGQLVPDFAAADDLAQNVFVKLLRRAQAGSPLCAADPELIVWLLRVARNECIDHARGRAVHRRLLDAVRSGVGRYALRLRRTPPPPDRSMEQAEFLGRFRRALAELPESQLSTFLLRERDGLTYEEIAAVMECSPKTVSTRLHRARMTLRELLLRDAQGGGGAFLDVDEQY